MTYKYFNQHNYSTTPYPSSSNPKATVETGGCGPTSAAMIISNMTTSIVDPIAMANYSIKNGARIDGGTDLNKLATAMSKDYGLTFTATTDETQLMAHLKTGGMAVANVGGDRPGYVGVFSDGGHFIVVAGLDASGKLIILDPGYYVGKFKKTGRAGKVTVNGNYCICDVSVLASDTSNRNPSYWLFKNGKGVNNMTTTVQPWMTQVMAQAQQMGIIKQAHDPLEVPNMATLCSMLINTINIAKGVK